ncbi:hypothetical protein [Streptomyces chilikensis]|uniref:Uncharacterized protein n=1 Tax=Streptomyces chilikensis TaxID=1194079 RepID=A0ABV3EZA9_9ACTN
MTVRPDAGLAAVHSVLLVRAAHLALAAVTEHHLDSARAAGQAAEAARGAIRGLHAAAPCRPDHISGMQRRAR